MRLVFALCHWLRVGTCFGSYFGGRKGEGDVTLYSTEPLGHVARNGHINRPEGSVHSIRGMGSWTEAKGMLALASVQPHPRKPRGNRVTSASHTTHRGQLQHHPTLFTLTSRFFFTIHGLQVMSTGGGGRSSAAGLPVRHLREQRGSDGERVTDGD